MRENYDRLRQARQGFWLTAVMLTIAAGLLVLASSGLQSGSQEMTRSFILGLKLSAPSLYPTGHGLRDVSYRHPAVDLRHGPQLPETAPIGRGGFFKLPAPGREEMP